jgi:Na+/H+ antiporter NhaD/arsenite permease-like protein
MDSADTTTAAELRRRLAEISSHEQGDPSRNALSGRDLGLFTAVTLGITLLGFLVLAL